MKNTMKKYSELYEAILCKKVQVNFSQFLRLHELKVLDPGKIKFVVPAFDQDGFGHFEIERMTPSYNYKIFFSPDHTETDKSL